ncbi:hypothetical protein [Streptomyces sp. NPDC052107]|uniref:hypothetical protein n=1 Tax=Streptomyces sp. NPDC052107 TaxID=3155632 RepID=UPI0034403F24
MAEVSDTTAGGIGARIGGGACGRQPSGFAAAHRHGPQLTAQREDDDSGDLGGGVPLDPARPAPGTEQPHRIGQQPLHTGVEFEPPEAGSGVVPRTTPQIQHGSAVRGHDEPAGDTTGEAGRADELGGEEIGAHVRVSSLTIELVHIFDSQLGSSGGPEMASWIGFGVITSGALFLVVGLILAGVPVSFLANADRARGTVVSLE